MTTSLCSASDAPSGAVLQSAAADFYVIADPEGPNHLPTPTRPVMTVATALAAITRPDNPLSVWRVLSTEELLAARRLAFASRTISEVPDLDAVDPHPEPCLAFDGGNVIGHFTDAFDVDGLRGLEFTWQGRRFTTIIDLEDRTSFPTAVRLRALLDPGAL